MDFSFFGEREFHVTRDGELYVSGMQYLDDGRLIQNIFIDELIPKENREMIAELIQFCLDFCKFPQKVNIEIDRELTPFERKLAVKSIGQIDYVDGNFVGYFENWHEITKYNVNDKPSNKTEEKIAKIWKQIN